MMIFDKVESDYTNNVWKSGLYSIHLFNYTYDGRACDTLKKEGFWAYYDGTKIEGNNRYGSFSVLEQAIIACNNHAERIK